MNIIEAKHALRRHAIGVDLEGVWLPEDDSMALCLRPYKGIYEKHFIEILQALVSVADEIKSSDRADREVIYLLWELTRFVRCATAGPHEPTFHGKKLISPDDKRMIDGWMWIIESATLDLLQGRDVANALGSFMADYIFRNKRGQEYAFLTALLSRYLKDLHEEEGVITDDEKPVICHTLVAIGGHTAEVVDLLKSIAANSKSAAARKAAQSAIDSL